MKTKSIITLLLLSSLALLGETGDASWYGEKFQGNPTASGEPFDMYAYTTAHRTLPFGTILTVTNLINNKSVDVRVNDRGPFKASRILDLSYQAAKELGILDMGVAKVNIEIKDKNSVKSVVRKSTVSSDNPYLTDTEEATIQSHVVSNDYLPSNVPTNSSPRETSKRVDSGESVKLQVASFSSKINAENFIERESSNGYAMKVIDKYSSSSKKTLYKVVILCHSDSDAKNIISSKKYSGAYLLH